MLNEMKSAFGGNKLKRFLVGAAAGAMLLANTVMPAGAAAPYNVTGEYDITFMLTGDPTPYVHDVSLVQTGTSVDGVGGHPANAAHTYEWDVITRTVVRDTKTQDENYTSGAIETNMKMDGTSAPEGYGTGTCTDDFGGIRTGTWSITQGVSTPFINIPSNGSTVTQAALVKVDWTDAVGANPPFQYRYEAYSNPTYTTLVYGSGWVLTNSEIPTPGTPPGEYYLRVQARDEGLVESAWSNDAANPYHITVTSDPVNPFPVPAQCDQTIAYNLIEGTNDSEVLNGTEGPDLILAKGGSDVVNGHGGNDCIDGGNGSDALHGQGGNDVILGGNGSDAIQGNEGNDWLYGQDGSDSVKGASGDDHLFGGANSDALKGDGGTDTADGGASSDACNAETETTCEV